eukprot:2749577-Amphidinium_carterae.1
MYKLKENDASRGDARWERGVFLGTKYRNSELYVGTLHGVVTSRSVRRLFEPDQIDAELFNGFVGVPWQL